MSFKTRNLYYLRISEHSVLPVYLYLDERHLDWMSDLVLQHVLSDLRPRILPKLLAEAGVLAGPSANKKAVVDTHHGDTYQFCYFLRRTECHSVAIKTRNYVARTRPSTGPAPEMSLTHLSTTNRQTSRRKRKTRSTSTPVDSPPSRSTKRLRKVQPMEVDSSSDQDRSGTGPDEEMVDVDVEDADNETYDSPEDSFDLPADEEEKPKPALQLKYQGFGIYGQCLCIVVEPWPAIRCVERPHQELGGIIRPKTTQIEASIHSAKTIAARVDPLFLSDEDDVDLLQNQRPNTVTTAWDDFGATYDSDDDSEMGGMMAFSQALNMAGDNRPGAAEDDDEMEGTVLFGDADEVRQL